MQTPPISASDPLLLITRPAEGAARFAARANAAFPTLSVLCAPLLEIARTPWTPPVEAPDAVALTSASALPALKELVARGLAPRHVFAVGPQTAEAVRALNLPVTAGEAGADALVGIILAGDPGTSILHLHGRHVTGDLVGQLRAAGHAAEGAVVYEQRPIPLKETAREKIRGAGRVIAPVFSPRSALRLAAEIGPLASELRIVAISTAARAALPPTLNPHISVARAPNGQAMIDAIGRVLSP